MHYADSFCHDFARFVLLRTLRGVYSYGSSAKLDSLEIISGAAFRIIGLTKIPKIEFLPLDWIYLSIRINTVIDALLKHLNDLFCIDYRKPKSESKTRNMFFFFVF